MHRISDVDKDNFTGLCSECGRVAVRIGQIYKGKTYYRCFEQIRQYVRDNNISHNARTKKYRDLHPEYYSAYDKQYQRNNKDHLRDYRKLYKAANKAKRREYDRQQRVKFPEKVAAKASRRRTREKIYLSKDDIGISVEYRKAIKDDPCFWCGIDAEAKHTDHIIPLSKGGTDHWYNLARSCATCNLRKNDLMPGEWLAKLESEREGNA